MDVIARILYLDSQANLNLGRGFKPEPGRGLINICRLRSNDTVKILFLSLSIL